MKGPTKAPSLLFATVGGSDEPIVFSLLHWRPLKVVFVVSSESELSVPRIVSAIQDGGYKDFDAGRYECIRVRDAQDYERIVHELRVCDEMIRKWPPGKKDAEILSTAEIIADITGGTKPMSAALALSMARWPCKIFYVGGCERTKGGVGTVVTGQERPINVLNPWDSLGTLALDQAMQLLEKNAFAAAAEVLDAAKKRVSDPARKEELNAAARLAAALADWDRFQHSEALNKLTGLPKQANNLEAALGHERVQRLRCNIEHLRSHCESITKTSDENGKLAPSRELVIDLLANARRRCDEQRWDDATARFYRAIEAIAQLRLARHGFPDTGAVPVERLPEALRSELAAAASRGEVALGLQHAWRLLAELGDPAASIFVEEFGDSKKSPLMARNASILAHGFSPVSEKTAKRLRDAVLKVFEVAESELPIFRWD